MSNLGTLPERLERRLDKSSDCWEWTGCKSRHGYGWIRAKERAMHTHRVAWEIANGPIPEGMWVLHSCDNPPCCNPAHLHLGTPADNSWERIQRGRNSGAKGTAHPNSKLTDMQVIEIRRRYADTDIRQEDLAREYGVCTSTVSHIVRRFTWKHI